MLNEDLLEGLAIEVDTSLHAERVIHVLQQVMARRERPQTIRLDNGPKFVAERKIELPQKSRPPATMSGRPTHFSRPA